MNDSVYRVLREFDFNGINCCLAKTSLYFNSEVSLVEIENIITDLQVIYIYNT